MKMLRMTGVLALVIAMFVIGYNKLLNNNISAGTDYSIFAWVVLIVGAVTVLFVSLKVIFKQCSIEKIFPLVVLVWGTIFIFLIPAYDTPDEMFHYQSSYLISNEMVERDNAATGYIRSCDISYDSVDLKEKYYDNFFDKLEPIKDGGSDKVPFVYRAIDNSKLFYYLPAVGIYIAKLMNLNFGWTYVFGAFLNLLFFTLLSTYAIRKIPFGKRMIFVISLLPITMQQVSSFSYDSGVFALCFVIISLSLYWNYGDKTRPSRAKWDLVIPVVNISLTEMLMYLFCSVMLINAKRAAFAILILLPFVFAMKKEWFRNKKIVILIIAAVLALGCVYLFFFGGLFKILVFLYSTPHDVRTIVGQDGVAPIEYIRNPARLGNLLLNTLKYRVPEYAFHLGGGALGNFRIFLSNNVVIINLIILLCTVVRYDAEKEELGLAKRIVAFLFAMVPIAITFVAMMFYWTLPSDLVVEGFQGRYFIPTMLLVIVALFRWKKIKIPNIDSIFVIASTFMMYTSCLNALNVYVICKI